MSINLHSLGRNAFLTYFHNELHIGGTRLYDIQLGTKVHQSSDRNLQAVVGDEEGKVDSHEKQAY